MGAALGKHNPPNGRAAMIAGLICAAKDLVLLLKGAFFSSRGRVILQTAPPPVDARLQYSPHGPM